MGALVITDGAELMDGAALTVRVDEGTELTEGAIDGAELAVGAVVISVPANKMETV